MTNECDTLLMVGSFFPYSEFLPRDGQARGVQIDIDGRMLNLRYPMEVGLVGDAKTTLHALIPHLQPKADRSWQNRIEPNADSIGIVIASAKEWWDGLFPPDRKQ